MKPIPSLTAAVLCAALALPNPAFDRGSQELVAGNGAASSKFSFGNVPLEDGASSSRSHALRAEHSDSGLVQGGLEEAFSAGLEEDLAGDIETALEILESILAKQPPQSRDVGEGLKTDLGISLGILKDPKARGDNRGRWREIIGRAHGDLVRFI